MSTTFTRSRSIGFASACGETEPWQRPAPSAPSNIPLSQAPAPPWERPERPAALPAYRSLALPEVADPAAEREAGLDVEGRNSGVSFAIRERAKKAQAFLELRVELVPSPAGQSRKPASALLAHPLSLGAAFVTPGSQPETPLNVFHPSSA